MMSDALSFAPTTLMMKATIQLIAMCMGACGLAYAQAPSRAAEIEAARTQKELSLKPQVDPKWQSRVERIESSIPYRLLGSNLNGLGVSFGNVVPGSGFAAGLQYKRNDLWGERLTASVSARTTMNKSYIGQLELSVPQLFRGWAFMDFTATHRNISQMPYYGAGPESVKDGRSNYRLEDTNVELRPGVRIFKGLRAAAIGSWLAVNTGAGNSSRFISSELQYGPETAPGIDRQAKFWRGGGLIEYDWRNRASSSDATSGGKYEAQFIRYLATGNSPNSFLRLDINAEQYIPLFNHTRVVALRGASSLTTTRPTEVVPFYLQPTLGGPQTLRGYRFNRFYGNNSTMVSGEYRWHASPLLQVVAFADAGKVFNKWEHWNFHDLESAVGFGFRFRGQRSVAFSVDTGFSHEGFQIWFRMNSAR
ncbi:MAG: BamA/TamA family outer membrane protein [Bryobacteraceae bacterium]|nr:BamA/TamA family outer membrane protein [Bryobacteraceae bacterium]